jgi:hypothetical protein
MLRSIAWCPASRSCLRLQVSVSTDRAGQTAWSSWTNSLNSLKVASSCLESLRCPQTTFACQWIEMGLISSIITCRWTWLICVLAMQFITAKPAQMDDFRSTSKGPPPYLHSSDISVNNFLYDWKHFNMIKKLTTASWASSIHNQASCTCFGLVYLIFLALCEWRL